MVRIITVITSAAIVEIGEQADDKGVDLGREQFLTIRIHPIPMADPVQFPALHIRYDIFTHPLNNFIHIDNQSEVLLANIIYLCIITTLPCHYHIPNE